MGIAKIAASRTVYADRHMANAAGGVAAETGSGAGDVIGQA